MSMGMGRERTSIALRGFAELSSKECKTRRLPPRTLLSVNVPGPKEPPPPGRTRVSDHAALANGCTAITSTAAPTRVATPITGLAALSRRTASPPGTDVHAIHQGTHFGDAAGTGPYASAAARYDLPSWMSPAIARSGRDTLCGQGFSMKPFTTLSQELLADYRIFVCAKIAADRRAPRASTTFTCSKRIHGSTWWR